MFANIWHWKHLGLEIHLWLYIIISLVSSDRISLFSWVPLLFIFLEIYSLYIVRWSAQHSQNICLMICLNFYYDCWEHFPYILILVICIVYFHKPYFIFPYEIHCWGWESNNLMQHFSLTFVYCSNNSYVCVHMFIKMNI